MIRKLMFLLTVLLCVATAAAGESLTEQYAAQLAQEIPQMLSNEVFVDMFTNGSTQVEEILAPYRQMTWARPKNDVYLSLDVDAVPVLSEASGMELPENAAQCVQDYATVLMSHFLADLNDPTEAIAAFLLKNSLFYADPTQPEGMLMFVRLYEDGAPIVFFQRAMNGAVELNASVLVADAPPAECGDVQAFQIWLDTTGREMLIASAEPVVMALSAPELTAGTFHENATRMALALHKRMADADYVRMVSSGDEDVAELMQAWAQDTANMAPRAIAGTVLMTEHAREIWGQEAASLMAEGNTPEARLFWQMLPTSVTTPMLFRYASDHARAMNARNMFSISAIYADAAQPERTGIYFLVYEEGAIEVAYFVENGVVVMNAAYLPVKELGEAKTEEELAAFLAENGFSMESQTSAPVSPTPAPTVTPSPTKMPDLLATPEGQVWKLVTATPRPTDAPLPEDAFMANAVEIARRIDLLAKSEAFIYYWDYSALTMKEIEALTRGDHTNPDRIYEMTGDDMLAALAENLPEGAVLPDLTRPEMRRDLVSALPDMLLSERGEEEMSLLHLLWRYKVFASEDREGCGLMLMLYEDAVPIAVTWHSDRGAVSMAACFLPDEALQACRSAEEAAVWFAGKGLPAATFKEVTWR